MDFSSIVVSLKHTKMSRSWQLEPCPSGGLASGMLQVDYVPMTGAFRLKRLTILSVGGAILIRIAVRSSE